MDFPGAVTRLYNLFRIYKAKHYGDKGSGLFIQRYQTPKGASFLYVIMGAPKKIPKAKQKDLEIALEHSQTSNKLIIPKDFVGVRSYLSMIFPQIVRPEQQIIDLLKNLLAGLRLELVQNETLKYTFQNPQNPDIMIFDEEKDGQFSFYINFLNLKDSGLILAHERQIEYIRQMLDQDVNPNDMKNLPALRTGTTAVSFKKKDSGRELGEGHQKLQQVIQQRKSKEEIGKELAYSTTIDSFNPSKPAEIPTPETPKSAEVKLSGGSSSGLFGMLGGRPPVKRPTPAPTPNASPTSTSAPMPAPAPMLRPTSSSLESQKQSDTANRPYESIFPPVNPAELPIIEEVKNPPIIEEDTKKMPTPQIQEIGKLTERIKILESENEGLKRQATDMTEKLARNDALEAENELLKRQTTESTDKLTQILQQKDQEIEQYKAFFSKKDGETVQYQEEYKKIVDNLKSKDEEIHNIQEQLRQNNENLQFALKKAQELEKMLEEKAIIVQEISKQNSQFDDTIEQLSQERAEMTEKIENQEKQINELQTQVKTATQAATTQTSTKTTELEAQIIELQEDNEQLAESLKEADLKYKIIFEEHSKLLKEKIKWESKSAVREEKTDTTKTAIYTPEPKTEEIKKESETPKVHADDKDWDKI